jgi:hypothetical protein
MSFADSDSNTLLKTGQILNKLSRFQKSVTFEIGSNDKENATELTFTLLVRVKPKTIAITKNTS